MVLFFLTLDYCPALLINSLASFQTHTQADVRFPIIELLVQEFVIFQPGSWLLLLIEVPPDCSYFSPAEKKFKEKTTHMWVLTVTLPDRPHTDDLSPLLKYAKIRDRQQHKNESPIEPFSQAFCQTPHSCQHFNEKSLSKSWFFQREIDSKMNKPEKSNNKKPHRCTKKDS